MIIYKVSGLEAQEEPRFGENFFCAHPTKPKSVANGGQCLL